LVFLRFAIANQLAGAVQLPVVRRTEHGRERRQRERSTLAGVVRNALVADPPTTFLRTAELHQDALQVVGVVGDSALANLPVPDVGIGEKVAAKAREDWQMALDGNEIERPVDSR